MAWRRPRINPRVIKVMPLLEVGDIIVLTMDYPPYPILIHRIVRQNYDYIIWGLDIKKQVIVKKQLSPIACKKYIKTHIKGEIQCPVPVDDQQ